MTTPAEQVVPGLRLLLVDDDRVDRRVVVRALRQLGKHEITECPDPHDAIGLVAGGDFDCVLLDFCFPGGNAFELFGAMLAEPCSQRPAIVMLTGLGDEQVAAQCIQRGAQGYLGKQDVTPDSLSLALRSAMAAAELKRTIERREQELTRTSLYDALTELPNRRLFFERTDQAAKLAKRQDQPFALLMMDLNLFKAVNDVYGHAAGDDLLRQVATRLLDVVRASDTVARLGGDEFAVLLNADASEAAALTVSKKIVAALELPFLVEGKVVQIGTCIGLAVYGSAGTDPDTMLRNADMAMYNGKRSSCAINVAGPGTEGLLNQQLQISNALPDAVANDQLLVEFQPQVRLADGRLHGVEALVRWQHPELGLLPPDKFIPAAETSGHMRALTERVLDRSLAALAGWLGEGADLTLSVNLSACLLDWPGLVDLVADRLAAAQVPAQRLCLEVTETGIMRFPERAAELLVQLHRLGCELSIDDFGTGYSSLKYLRHFPIDEIKIDRLFVAELCGQGRDEMIVASVLGLAEGFGVRVVAEGVEDAATAERLLAMGCPLAQGHHFAASLPAPEFAAGWLAAGARPLVQGAPPVLAG